MARFFLWADARITVQLKSQGRVSDGVTANAVPQTYLSLLGRLARVALGYERLIGRMVLSGVLLPVAFIWICPSIK